MASNITCILMVLLMGLIHSLHGAFNDSGQYIPMDVNCEISSPEQSNRYGTNITTSWSVSSNDIIYYVRRYDMYCNCSTSGYEVEVEIPNLCNPPCFHQVPFTTIYCYDECQCSVRIVTRGAKDYILEWSDPSTCSTGPTVPKAPPVVLQSPVRNSDGRSVQVAFELPPVNYYCDSYTAINSVTVIITTPSNESYQYISNQTMPERTGSRSYTYTFQVESSVFWRSFNIKISVSNSIGPSPFSDHVTMRGAKNEDIQRSEYNFQSIFDPNHSALLLVWDISRKLETMKESGFIIGFNFTIEQQNVSNSEMIYFMSTSTSSTLNLTLKPNQWHLVIGRILTEDNDSWGPEPSYSYFKTPGNSPLSNNNGDLHLTLILTSAISCSLTVILLMFLLIYIIIRCCVNRNAKNLSDDSINERMYNTIDIGSVPDTSVYRPEQSLVEDLPDSDSTSDRDATSQNEHDLSSKEQMCNTIGSVPDKPEQNLIEDHDGTSDCSIKWQCTPI